MNKKCETCIHCETHETMKSEETALPSGNHPTHVELPYGIGDTVYFLYGELVEGTISELRVRKTRTSIKVDFNHSPISTYIYFDINELGKKWFLNKEEGEIAREEWCKNAQEVL